MRLATSSILALLAALASAPPAVFPAPRQAYNTETSQGGPLPAAQVASETPLPPGFRMSVFASEPDVRQPISMTTDARGRLWVAENDTYSERAVGYHPELRDRIVVFEDNDNDGSFDRRMEFWDNARQLTSVEVGLGGVWALALPNLYFIPDANGDAVPDGPPQIVLDGFEYQTGRHTIANGLRWGPDGWLYGRHGIQSTSQIGPPGAPPAERVAMNVGIWRYHPGRRVTEIVAQGTTNPWGMDWDRHGELFFINTVIGHLWHVIPGAHYRRMYGNDPTPHIYESLDQTADHVHWASGEDWTDVRKGVTDLTGAAGGGHAHTGLLIYQGGQWPESWNGKMLTINFHGRRLNVDRLARSRSGFVGHHQPDAFFFADPWFRGIDLIAAPDGGIFVSDWNDAGECHDHDGIHRTSGRIYKLGYGRSTSNTRIDLTALSNTELAALQTNPNDWQARQARRVLADRARRGHPLADAREALSALASHANEVVRLRTLWALHITGGVDPNVLLQKLRGSEHERVWALRLLEDSRHDRPAAGWFDQLVRSDLPSLAAAEPSPLVRVTLASLLRTLALDQRWPLAKSLLSREEDADDPAQPLMLWYALEPLALTDPGFAELIAHARIPKVQRLAARRLAEEMDHAQTPLNALLLAVLDDPSIASRQAVLDGLADGLAGRLRLTPPAAWPHVQSRLAKDAPDTLQNRLRDLAALFGEGRAMEEIAEVALDSNADLPRRRAALRSLVDARADDLRQICERLLPVRELSGEAARGLALFDDPEIADQLITEWPKLYGAERPPVMNALLSRPAWIARLLDAIAAGTFRRSELSTAHARQIKSLDDHALTDRLAKAWGTLQEPDEAARQAALRRWKSVLTPEALQRADLREGRKLYTLTCGACHRLYGEGGSLGPDLTGAGRQNLDYLLENILFPSALVPADYRVTLLTLKDGRSLSGVMRQRTARTLVLEMIGETTTLSLSQIEEESTSDLSIMPDGQLDPLTDAQAIQLIGYLMSPAPPPPPRAGAETE